MALVVVTSAVLVGYSTATNLGPFPSAAYVPANLALAAGVVLAARRRGLSWEAMGVGRGARAPGLRWGGGIVLVVGLGLAVAALLPIGRELLADQRVLGVTGLGLAYRTLVRIPIGTAIVEEVLFRGVLFGALLDEGGTRVAIVGSSVVFGLWHIGPAFDLIAARQLADATLPVSLLVAGAVVGSALGGVVLAVLREVSRGIVAPVIVHAGTNSLATLAAAWVQS